MIRVAKSRTTILLAILFCQNVAAEFCCYIDDMYDVLIVPFSFSTRSAVEGIVMNYISHKPLCVLTVLVIHGSPCVFARRCVEACCESRLHEDRLS